MKILSCLGIFLVCALFVSCEKKQSEADRAAQIEKEVQARLEAEHRLQENHRLAQQKAELDAREKALAAQEAAGAHEAEASATPRVVVADRESASEEQTQSYDTFYRGLEPYGAWRESADYGYVWQPSVAADSRDWRPYTDGRWAYTEAGWTWISDEPFGWACYHYGRWTRLRDVGWVWVPGEEWAPAWVSWRTSDQHVGWAPLPPEARFERRTGIKHWADSYYDIDAGEYVFVPNEEIGDENIQGAIIPMDRNVTIVNETTNVTNITYINTIIVNQGPDYDALRAHSRRPVDRLRLQRQYGVEQLGARAVVRGDVLQMVTPFFTARATEKPRTSAPPIQRAAVEHLAPGGDQGGLERARQKMKSEATPPTDAPSKKFEKPVLAEPAATPVASATPAPSVSALPSVTPTIANTPAPSATVRPAFTPRATPLRTATPSTTTPIAPRPTPSAPPKRMIFPTPVPRLSPDSGEPKPVQAEGPDRAAMKLEEQRRRQEARDKLIRGMPNAPTPAAEASPVRTPAPRRVAPPRATPPLPMDVIEGTPSGIEMTPPPKPAPKRPPQTPSPTPTGGRQP